MRKLFISAVVAIAALALAAVAMAANTYTVDGSTSPKNAKGTPAKPKPVSLSFSYGVGETDPTKRGTPIKVYAIGSEGLLTYPQVKPTCTYAQATSTVVSPKCKKARVGGGLVQNVVGQSTDQSLASSLFCNLRLNLYNISGVGKNGGMAVRLDGDPPFPTDPNSKTIGCPTPIHLSIKAKFVQTKIGGLPADDLRFTVPPDLLHPSGLDNAVRNVISKIAKKTGKVKIKGKSRTVGYYSSVGCKGGKRTIQATFTDESGDRKTATKAKAC
jgi:hypothetical protein